MQGAFLKKAATARRCFTNYFTNWPDRKWVVGEFSFDGLIGQLVKAAQTGQVDLHKLVSLVPSWKIVL